MTDLPAPICRSGYTYDQVEEITGDLFDEFCDQFASQTGATCRGEQCNQPHGFVVRPWSLERFMKGHA